MTKFLLFTTLFAITVNAQIIIGKNIEPFKLNDQFDKTHSISKETKKIIFAFSKDIGHNVNAFLEKQDKNYLLNIKAQFVIDLSGAPGFVRSLFIVPKLEKYEYPVLIIEDEEIADRYKDEKNIDNIMVVTLDKQKVTSVEFFKDTKTLKDFLEK